jgi:predicted phosphoadenosine phosphosulfate sulfurtransferase
MKIYRDQNVLDAARDRVAYAFDNFKKISVSFSGGKDSSVMLHLVMDEAIRRGRTVGVLIIDMEAQYAGTIAHIREMATRYADHIDLHWVCVPLTLRNEVTNYEPKWTCWDPAKEEIWVRPLPGEASLPDRYPWFVPGMEFEEFVPIWSAWYADGEPLASFVGIRADESLNRFRTVASATKEMHGGHRWTTRVVDDVYNVYPLYDWRTQDIWRFHARYPDLPHNPVYDLMHQAGVPLSQQRLCQPYGDDQRRGLWLYHILEPETWFKLITRVNGANAGALYVQENGNVMGYSKITKPEGHTWHSFVNLLLMSLPKPTREHYIRKFRVFIDGWRGRGYDEIPDEAPKVLEDAHWAPSWRRMAKVLLRNDWWCKGLGLTQPKSDAYGHYLEIRNARKAKEKADA